ncbi:MAG: magnesium/cobalt transporter CorA [Planctomyces sp.]|nr:magnesium/cobalt transporter CorA [Planctomyces sp.]
MARRKKTILKGFQRSTGVGAVPGTISAPAQDAAFQIIRLQYTKEEVIEEQLPDFLAIRAPQTDKWTTWLQIHGQPSPAVLERLASEFGIHPLALEDVINTHQRCKAEDYGNHLFVVARVPVYREDTHLNTEQVSLFIGRGFVISISENNNPFGPVRDRILRHGGRMRELPADYLGYALLDLVTDNYFPVIEEIGNRLNAVDESLELQGTDGQRHEIRSLRSDLLLLRKTIWPQRDALASMMRDDCELISDSTRTYLRDCYDHTVQIIDVIETYRELCADLRDFHLAEISYRSNEVMKTLTIIATLFMPLSFIAGFYGMNFHYMPELQWVFGYPTVIFVMATVAASLVTWFWRKGWLKL